MTKAFRLFAVTAALAVVAPMVHAVTYIVPSDVEMIQKSDDIVVATGVTSLVERNDRGGIVTRYTLRIDEVLKGGRAPGSHLVLTERGGHLGDDIKYIPGTPQYQPGERYLVFTSANRDLEPITFGMGLGQFFYVDAAERMLLLRGDIDGFDSNLDPYSERARDAKGFVTYIRGIVAQKIAPEPTYFVDGVNPRFDPASEWQVAANATRGSYLMSDGGKFFRYQTPTNTIVKSGTASGVDGNASVSLAISQWNGTASDIDYDNGGQDNTAMGGLETADGKSAVLFNDPNNEIPDGSGIAGLGGISSTSGSYTLDSEPFWKINEVDVVMANGSFAQNCYNSVAVHEVGHTLGFKHAAESPNQANAIMNWQVSCSWNGVLKQYDQDAAATVYGTGPVCNPPSISSHPASITINQGSSTTLSVAAGGTAPLVYQWFIGNSGDTSTPTGSNSPSLNVSPTTTTSYWVRVSNSCTSGPAANSNTATVTVNCANAAISTHPANKSITNGQSTQLSVSATGTSRSYQWFIGNSGDMSQPTGGNSSTLTVSPNVTTNYWVRVSAACGSPVNSNTATVTVTECAGLSITNPTATPGAGSGQFTLHLEAASSSMPLKFEWYRGETPGVGGTKVGSTQSLFVTVTQVTSFWARVENQCGRVAISGLVTVAPCTLPAITAQPVDKTVTSGGSATLTIAFTGAGTTVKWYQGIVGDKTTLVGSTPTINVGPLTATTPYWAEVANTCGPIASRQVTVTVEPLTETLLMLNGRFTVIVQYKNQFENPPSEGRLKGRSLSSQTLSDTAIFTFGDPTVIELMVRLSDARPFDNHIHVFYGGLSDIEFFITVTDSLTGASTEYHKPANQLIGEVDRTTFIAVPGGSMFQSGVNALMAQTAARGIIMPAEDSSTVRMLNGRYEVQIEFVNIFANPPVTGHLLGRTIASTPMTETVVWFVDPASVEWMVRFSDARPFDEHIHFFHGGLTDLEITIKVLDTVTGLRREYHKAAFSLVGEVDRFTWIP